MYGAILGDIIGVPYEFDRGDKSKDFELFNEKSQFSDDTVMTIAVADALMEASLYATEEVVKEELIMHMVAWGQKYPFSGYGMRFMRWLYNPVPYGSCGNGSAMRVSSVGWLYTDIEKTRKVARWPAEISHNYPEGIKGAESTASAIYLARNGYSKNDIKKYIISEFGYDLSRNCDEIRPCYHHVETCQETVPEAITAFLEGNDFEDVIRTAISLGGDSDTLACIAGSIAEAFFDIPKNLQIECKKYMDKSMIDVLDRFNSVRMSSNN